MDTDGLIFAGKGMDQVTWMDVCVDGILPTPRHGKPVEINGPQAEGGVEMTPDALHNPLLLRRRQHGKRHSYRCEYTRLWNRSRKKSGTVDRIFMKYR